MDMNDRGMSVQADPHFMGMDRFILFYGIVEDREDPICLGRCRIRIFGVHPEDTEIMPKEDLPWAMPIMPITGNHALGGIGHSPVGPVPGTHVVGFFADGLDRQQPLFFGVINAGAGAFNFGADQPQPDNGSDGNSGYGPRGDGPVSGTGNYGDIQPRGSKDMYNYGAHIAASLRQSIPWLKDHHACAIVGNLCGESKLRTITEGSKNNKTPPPRGTKNKGYGWAQWTNSRLDLFLDWCDKNKLPYDSEKANMGFLVHELTTSFKKMMGKFKQGGTHTAPSNPKGPHNLDTLEGATAYFMGDFERPAARVVSTSLPERIGHAKGVLAAMNKSGAPVRSTATPEKPTNQQPKK